MSHNTWSDVVPFVIFDFISVQDVGDDHPLGGAENWVEGDMCDDEEEVATRDINCVELNGWTYAPDANNACGERNKLYGEVWTDEEDHKVFVINTSPYSHVGEYEMAVCANDLESLEIFKDDFAFDNVVQENESVQQSG